MALTNLQDNIDQRRERVAQLKLRGLSSREIARALAQGDKNGNGRIVSPRTGRPFEHAVILSDIAALKLEWKESRGEAFDAHVDREFVEINEIKKAAWSTSDPELALKALDREMRLLGTAKPQELNINVNITVTVQRIIELAESMDMNASEVFETALRRLDALKKLQDANS